MVEQEKQIIIDMDMMLLMVVVEVGISKDWRTSQRRFGGLGGGGKGGISTPASVCNGLDGYGGGGGGNGGPHRLIMEVMVEMEQ